ncbi:unnamed protein product, partial [Symbiodinium necroappetens]
MGDSVWKFGEEVGMTTLSTMSKYIFRRQGGESYKERMYPNLTLADVGVREGDTVEFAGDFDPVEVGMPTLTTSIRSQGGYVFRRQGGEAYRERLYPHLTLADVGVREGDTVEFTDVLLMMTLSDIAAPAQKIIQADAGEGDHPGQGPRELLGSVGFGLSSSEAELQDAEAGPEVQKSFKSLPPEPVVVQTVAPATWGSDRGIQGGQQIVAINGLDVATMRQQEFRAALEARPLTLRFRISDDPEEEPLQAAVASSDVDKLGMSFQSLPPEPVIVNKVATGGWAESVGFLGGEEIIVVNGESTIAMSSEDFKAALRVRPLVLRFQQPAEEEDEQDDLVQEVEVGPEVSKIGLSFHNLPPEPVVVNKVAAGTWAESVGFIGGEEILALNDEDVASMT